MYLLPHKIKKIEEKQFELITFRDDEFERMT